MMMAMLNAGGMPLLVDNERGPDVSNPKGYYELEIVKRLSEDQTWLHQARGKAVKIISQLIVHLPTDQRYKVIFMRRDMREILASQQAMLANLPGPAAAGGNDEVMAAIFEQHLSQTENWLTRQPNIDTLAINYNDILAAPNQAVVEIDAFLGDSLDRSAMTTIVDRALHRQRAPSDQTTFSNRSSNSGVM